MYKMLRQGLGGYARQALAPFNRRPTASDREPDWGKAGDAIAPAREARSAVACLAAIWLLVAVPAWADYPLEIVKLRARVAEEIVPLVAPLAGPDGAVTGTGGTLVIRAAPGRVAEIRRALESIDRPPRRGISPDGVGLLRPAPSGR